MNYLNKIISTTIRHSSDALIMEPRGSIIATPEKPRKTMKHAMATRLTPYDNHVNAACHRKIFQASNLTHIQRLKSFHLGGESSDVYLSSVLIDDRQASVVIKEPKLGHNLFSEYSNYQRLCRHGEPFHLVKTLGITDMNTKLVLEEMQGDLLNQLEDGFLKQSIPQICRNVFYEVEKNPSKPANISFPYILFYSLAEQLVKGAIEIAKSGHIHKDLKIENIFWVIRNEQCIFKIGDFGTLFRIGQRISIDSPSSLVNIPPELLTKTFIISPQPNRDADNHNRASLNAPLITPEEFDEMGFPNTSETTVRLTEKVMVFQLGQILYTYLTGRTLSYNQLRCSDKTIGSTCFRQSKQAKDEIKRFLDKKFPQIMAIINHCTAISPDDRPSLEELKSQLFHFSKRIVFKPKHINSNGSIKQQAQQVLRQFITSKLIVPCNNIQLVREEYPLFSDSNRILADFSKNISSISLQSSSDKTESKKRKRNLEPEACQLESLHPIDSLQVSISYYRQLLFSGNTLAVPYMNKLFYFLAEQFQKFLIESSEADITYVDISPKKIFIKPPLFEQEEKVWSIVTGNLEKSYTVGDIIPKGFDKISRLTPPELISRTLMLQGKKSRYDGDETIPPFITESDFSEMRLPSSDTANEVATEKMMIWQLFATLYNILSGQELNYNQLLTSDSQIGPQTYYDHKTNKHIFEAFLPEVMYIINRCTAARPEERPGVEELSQMLDRFYIKTIDPSAHIVTSEKVQQFRKSVYASLLRPNEGQTS